MRDFSCASSELQVTARNSHWFVELFVPVVIGRSNCFGFGFSTVMKTALLVLIKCILQTKNSVLSNEFIKVE